MFLLKLKGGIELTEAELGSWDNVPANAEIEALAIAVPRPGANPYIIDYKGYELYCCARIGSAAQGVEGSSIGYSVALIKDRQVTEHDILPEGMRLRSYPEDKCEIPTRCFRRGKI